MSTQRKGHSASVIAGQLYVAGGEDARGVALNSVECFGVGARWRGGVEARWRGGGDSVLLVAWGRGGVAWTALVAWWRGVDVGGVVAWWRGVAWWHGRGGVGALCRWRYG